MVLKRMVEERRKKETWAVLERSGAGAWLCPGTSTWWQHRHLPQAAISPLWQCGGEKALLLPLSGLGFAWWEAAWLMLQLQGLLSVCGSGIKGQSSDNLASSQCAFLTKDGQAISEIFRKKKNNVVLRRPELGSCVQQDSAHSHVSPC